MSKLGRIWNVIVGFFIIICSLIMMLFPKQGYYTIILILGVVLVVSGFRQIIYYLSMGIHMVGGKVILFKGVLLLDLGAFTLGISGMHQRYIMIYLLLYYIFFGAIDILRALEARRLDSPAWKMKLGNGIFCLLISCFCIYNMGSLNLMIDLLCGGFIYSGITRIVLAFRRTAVIYIQ